MTNNEEQYLSRTELLFGREAMNRLAQARVAVFGIGGVGGYVAEALARSGIGTLDLFDHDTVSITNLNRQIVALHSTLGHYKVDVMKSRIADISPTITVNAHRVFFMPDNAGDYDFSVYSYVVDAVDTVTAKLEIITRAKAAGVPVISCMGTGNKRDPSKLTVTDIHRTSECPLARVMRRELRVRDIRDVKAVYSKEPVCVRPDERPEQTHITASTAFVPSAAGLLLASEVVNTLANSK